MEELKEEVKEELIEELMEEPPAEPAAASSTACCLVQLFSRSRLRWSTYEHLLGQEKTLPDMDMS